MYPFTRFSLSNLSCCDSAALAMEGNSEYPAVVDTKFATEFFSTSLLDSTFICVDVVPEGEVVLMVDDVEGANANPS